MTREELIALYRPTKSPFVNVASRLTPDELKNYSKLPQLTQIAMHIRCSLVAGIR